MKPQVAPLEEILRLNGRLFLNTLEGVDEDTAQRRVTENVNNMTFIALHLLDARCYLARMLGADVEHPYQEALDAVKSIDEMPSFPELEGIRVTWREVSDVLIERFSELSDLELKERAPVEFPVGDGTVLGGIAFLLQHESFHIGQLAFLRKMSGHASMNYW